MKIQKPQTIGKIKSEENANDVVIKNVNWYELKAELIFFWNLSIFLLK